VKLQASSGRVWAQTFLFALKSGLSPRQDADNTAAFDAIFLGDRLSGQRAYKRVIVRLSPTTTNF
jgi:hypothetical protein